MLASSFATAPHYNYVRLERHMSDRRLALGAVVEVTNFVARGLSLYKDCVGRLVSVYKIYRDSPFCVFSVAFNAITPEAQDTLWKLQHKAYAAMLYIMELVVAGQLLLVKRCQLSPVETDVLSDIDYVLLERRTPAPKRKRECRALPPAKRWSAQDAATVAGWQLGMLASTAQLAGAAAAYAGAAGGAARAANVFITLTTKDEPQAVLAARQVSDKEAADARLARSQVSLARLANLREKEDQELKDRQLHAQKLQEEQAAARAQVKKDKQLHAQQLQEQQAAASASREARRKQLSEQRKLEKVVRKFMQRNQL